MPNTTQQRVAISLSAPQRTWLKAEAARLDLDVSEVVRRVLDERRGDAEPNALGMLARLAKIRARPGASHERLDAAYRLAVHRSAGIPADDATIEAFIEIVSADADLVRGAITLMFQGYDQWQEHLVEREKGKDE